MTANKTESPVEAQLALLQAPIADDMIAWKPIRAWDQSERSFAEYFPYIRQSTYEDRLDQVLSPENWWAEFLDKENITVCKLTITLPGERTVIREGVGAHNSKDEGHAEHGSRSRSFRDACERAGVCGRDLDGCRTKPVEIKVLWRNDNGKPQGFVPLQPLTRELLLFDGEVEHANRDPRPTVTASIDRLPTRNPEANEKQTNWDSYNEADVAPKDDGPVIPQPGGKLQNKHFDCQKHWRTAVWKNGKEKGKTLEQLHRPYLNWALENMDIFNAKSEWFSQDWLDAVLLAIEAKNKEEQEAGGR